MALYFVTGNKNKFAEVQAFIPEIEQSDLDLVEIQSLDTQKIITEKLKEATSEHEGNFFVEDTSLYIECLNGFPGPLVKWFKESFGIKGIAELVERYENKKARVKTVIGYSKGEDINFFTGELKGTIVLPRGESDFGFDPIFQPEGYDKTMAEMTADEKNAISMRNKAVLKLREYLHGHQQ